MAVETLERVAAALRRRGFDAVCCTTRAEAAAHVMTLAEGAATGVRAGCDSPERLGLVAALAAGGPAGVGCEVVLLERHADRGVDAARLGFGTLAENAAIGEIEALAGGRKHVRDGAQRLVQQFSQWVHSCAIL